MELAHDRIVNGLLKSSGGILSPEEFAARLNQDVEVVVPPSRATIDDLWPAIWSLAAVLERQLTGKIYLRGHSRPLPEMPSALSKRVVFTNEPREVALTIALGAGDLRSRSPMISGDAARGEISINVPATLNSGRPSPVECFLLSGHLGFASLALLAGIPPHREHFTSNRMMVPFDYQLLRRRLDATSAFTILGLGQLGQAYLALLFFLLEGRFDGRRVALIDYDKFQAENGRTQILLSEGDVWKLEKKVDFIGDWVQSLGGKEQRVWEKLGFTWKRPEDIPSLVFVGLHDLEGRRAACAAGFSEMIEAGVGTDLYHPRVTWHRLIRSQGQSKVLFPEPKAQPTRLQMAEAPWVERLKATPGKCGWVEFEGISATAPSLGIAAAAFALSELGRDSAEIAGSSLLWSQLLPIHREGLMPL